VAWDLIHIYCKKKNQKREKQISDVEKAHLRDQQGAMITNGL